MLLLVLLAAPASPATDPVVTAVLADLNAPERWLFDAYASDAARLKALRQRGARTDFRDSDEKRKFLADTRSKLVKFGEKEYGLSGGELGMLRAVLTDSAKDAAFREEAARTAPADRAARRELVGRWRKEVVGWADAYSARKPRTDLAAKTVEGMVAADERALLEQMRRNDESGFKVGVFTKWIGQANRKMAKGDPEGRKKALELVATARGGINENLYQYLRAPDIAKLREAKPTVLAKNERASPALQGAEAAPVRRDGKAPASKSVLGSLENAERLSKAAAGSDSMDSMLASASTPFGGEAADGKLVDAVSAGGCAGCGKADLAAAQTGPVSQKGLASKSVPQPQAQAAEKGASSNKAGNPLVPGLGAAGLGLIGFALLGPLGALVGACAGGLCGLYANSSKSCKSCGQ